MAEALLEHLAFLERRIEESEVHIQRQREIIAGLKLAGLDTTAAHDLLRVYQQTLAEHLAELERLRHELTTGVNQSVP